MNVFVDPKTKKPIISFHVFDDQYLSKESEQEKIGTKNASYMFNVILKSPKDLATLKKWAFEQQRAALKNGNQKAAATFAFFSKAMDKDEKLQNLAKDTLIKDLPVYQGDIEKPNTPITFDPVQVQRDYMKKGR